MCLRRHWSENVLFPSISFILYFLPTALALYWACYFSIPGQNFCLLVLSLIFYAWGEPLFLVPMAILIIGNHFLGLRLKDANNPAYIRRIVRLAVFLNIGMLLLIRHGPDLIYYIQNTTGLPIPLWNWTVPYGISFFTLQAFAYIWDIARGKARPAENILITGLFISFMPTILAGPILNFREVVDQFQARQMSWTLLADGCERFICGLAKLLLLFIPLHYLSANIFTLSANRGQTGDVPVTLAWLGLVAFGLQLYLLLSGLADMAGGMARLFGFSIKDNFNYPYTAHTLTEFWNRWNISLYRWFYVNVFLSMGGSRAKLVRYRGSMRPRNYVMRNLVALWLAIGLWYGFGLNYVAFSLWFLFFAFIEWVVTIQRKDTSRFYWAFYVLFVVGIGWVFLRCDSLEESIYFLSNLLNVNSNGFLNDFTVAVVKENWHVLLLSVLVAAGLPGSVLAWLRDGRNGVAGNIRALCYIVVMAALIYLCFVYLGVAQHVSFTLK